MLGLSVGNKIKKFREIAKMSQSALELEIDTSFGTISRIETGKVNPTKETLTKIVQVLKINKLDAADLFNININETISKILNISSKLHQIGDIDKILQQSVNEICDELNLVGAAIFIVKGKNLHAKTISNHLFFAKISKILGLDLSKYKLSLEKDTQSLLVSSVNKNQIEFGTNAKEFIVPVVNIRTANILQTISGHKSGIVFPLTINQKTIGGILFGKNYVDDFSNEKELLQAYADNISVAISNAEIFSNLNK